MARLQCPAYTYTVFVLPGLHPAAAAWSGFFVVSPWMVITVSFASDLSVVSVGRRGQVRHEPVETPS